MRCAAVTQRAIADFIRSFVSIIHCRKPNHSVVEAGITCSLNGDIYMSYSNSRRLGSGPYSGVARPALLWIALAAVSLTGCGKKEEAATAPKTVASSVAAGGSAEVTPGAVAAVMPASVPQLLDNAKTAFRQDRLVTPVGDNAIEYYLAVLGMEKDNIAATQGLVDLFPLVVSVAEKEIAARNVEEADRIIGLLDESSPNSYTVQKLKSRLAATQNQMQREEERRLAAEQAQQSRQAAAAEPEPVAAPPPASTASTAARDSARPAPAEPAETRPSPPVAAVAEPARPVGETRDAKVVRQVQPGYPQLAYRRRLAGWVEIQFTVGVNGRVSDVQVLRADPQRMFDREAVRAVEQWMFEPALRDGVPVPSTLSRRIEFKYPG